MKRILLSPLLLFFCLVPFAFAQQVLRNPQVMQGARHDVSPILRDMMRGIEPALDTGAQQVLEIEEPPARYIAPAFDPVVQSSPGVPQQAQILRSFEGITRGGATPPDTNGAPGLNQYVQITNYLYAVFDKASGAIIFGPYSEATLFRGFGGTCENPGQLSDPVVRFDRTAGRWVIHMMAGAVGWTPPFFICMAVSTSSDATGSYYRYAIPYNNYIPDYPKLGIWPDAYYLTTDIYNAHWSFQGSSACALDRNAMLQGGAASAICFQTDAPVFQFLPADLDGPTPPPQGAPNYIVGNVGGSNNTLSLWKLHVDFTNPQNSTFTGPYAISVAPYTIACWSSCVPQKDTSNQLDAFGAFMMYRLAYRNFVPPSVPPTASQAAHQAMVAEHSVQNNDGTIATRWYELRALEHSDFTVHQQGTFAPDSNSRWMGSIAMDKAGDIALGYSVSGSNTYPSIYFTGRIPTDPPNTMEQEVSILAGSNSQTDSTRWADYSSMVPDPADDCVLWYTTEYLQSGSQYWRTRIASLRFSSCQ